MCYDLFGTCQVTALATEAREEHGSHQDPFLVSRTKQHFHASHPKSPQKASEPAKSKEKRGVRSVGWLVSALSGASAQGNWGM